MNFLGFGSKIPSHFLSKRLVNRAQENLGYRFKKLELLGEALSHRSYTQTVENAPFPSYERLEFLGDSILGMIISEALFKKYKRLGEGQLTKIKATLVNVHTLSRISREISIYKFVKLSDEEEKAGGRERNSIIADCLEAIIGAIFLDGGIRAARVFVRDHFLEKIGVILSDQSLRNFKGELLELIQANSSHAPHYEVIKTEGPDHDKRFTMAVYLLNRKLGMGKGLTKKEAEQQAAQNALDKLATVTAKENDFFNSLEEK